MERTEWNLWCDFIGLYIGTGYLKSEQAESIVLVGDPGSGKSTLLSRFYDVPSVLKAADATAEGLKQQVFKDAITKGKRHLILPELYKLMQRRGPTADNTIGTLTAVMSGEMHDSYIGKEQHDQYPEGFQLGVIGAMPTKVYKDWNQTISNSGLIDRMPPVAFGFSGPMLDVITQWAAGGYRQPKVSFPWPDRRLDIGFDMYSRNRDLLALTAEITHGARPENRRVNALRVLAKSCAIMVGESEVKARHFELLAEFIPIWRGEHCHLPAPSILSRGV